MITSNKYSDKKIIWFPEKFLSFKNNIITPPIYVRIKPFNKCCHNCDFCIYRAKNSQMHETMNINDILSKEKTFEILNDFKDMGVKSITYSGGGEPLMHPNIVDILEKTKNNNIDLSILTNGQFLNKDRAKALINAKWVRISMDYCDSITFIHSNRGTKKMFEQVMSNIESFNKIRNPACDLTVNYIITKNNKSTILDIAKLLKSIGVDNVRYSPVWSMDIIEYHKEIKDEVLTLLKKAKEYYENDTFKIYDSYKITPNMLNRSYTKCYILQTIPVIGADEIVYNCHNKAYSEDGIIGSIKNQTFKEMWFSDKTKKHFENFNPQKHCYQCANDSKNIFIHELMDCYGDNFV